MFPKQPVIFQINAWVWLTQLESKYGAEFDLGSVPSSEWDALKDYPSTAFGLWEYGREALREERFRSRILI